MKADSTLIRGFLEENLEQFADYLEENEIEPTEADLIIDELQISPLYRNRKPRTLNRKP